jgi:hypothetical protein
MSVKCLSSKFKTNLSSSDDTSMYSADLTLLFLFLGADVLSEPYEYMDHGAC